MTPVTNPSEQLPQAFARTASTKPFPARKMRSLTALALGIAVLVSTVARDARALLPVANLYNVDETTTAAFGTLNQANVGPNGANGANNFCAPTATMNSFTFLENAYPSVYGNLLMGGQASWQLAGQLLAGATYMATDPNSGTSVANWVSGKVNYINKFAPNTTTFAGMGTGGYPWLNAANPTANFLLQQLQTGEDVELAIFPTVAGGIGHVLTLTGINWNDANGNNLFDAGDTLTLNTIDPGNPGVNTQLTLSPGGLLGITGANYNTYTLGVALAESPVPEPTTVSLILLSGGAIAFFRNHRAK